MDAYPAAFVKRMESVYNDLVNEVAEKFKDLEGLQTMRNLARNMSFMIKAFADAKEKYGEPIVERDSFTSFPDGK